MRCIYDPENLDEQNADTGARISRSPGGTDSGSCTNPRHRPILPSYGRSPLKRLAGYGRRGARRSRPGRRHHPILDGELGGMRRDYSIITNME